VVTVIYKI